MLQPKRTKFRKQFKGRNDGLSWSANAVSFGATNRKVGARTTSAWVMLVSQVQKGVKRGCSTGRTKAWNSSRGANVAPSTSTAPISMISVSSRGSACISSQVASRSTTR